MKIKVGNIDVEVIKKDIKNIHLAVYPPNGSVRLAAPLSVNDNTIRLYALSRIAWIRKQQRTFVSQDRVPPRKFIERESHYYLGKKYLLKVVESDKPAKVTVKGKTYIEMQVKPNTTLEQKKEIMNDWYRSELKRLLPEIIKKWEKKLGVQAEFWGVKQMKTKWGACNVKSKRLWFNLELAKKPIYCIEYLVVHELVHLLERLHNDKFMAYMDLYLPKWLLYKEELNKFPISHADWDY